MERRYRSADKSSSTQRDELVVSVLRYQDINMTSRRLIKRAPGIKLDIRITYLKGNGLHAKDVFLDIYRYCFVISRPNVNNNQMVGNWIEE